MKIIWIETKYKNYPINSENFVCLLTISLCLLNTHDTVITWGQKKFWDKIEWLVIFTGSISHCWSHHGHILVILKSVTI